MLGGVNADASLARVQRAQHGLASMSQARELNLSRKMLRIRVASGRLDLPQPKVFRATGSPRTWEQKVLAACMSLGNDAVASHRSAAALWDLDGPRDVVEVALPRGKAQRRAGVVVHRTSDLLRKDVTVRDGIPVTKLARTLVDLGAVVPRWQVDAAIDVALARRLVTLEGLWWMLARVARCGRNGAGVLRACLDWRFGVPDSVLEGLFLRLVRDFDLPKPEVQFEVIVDGKRRRIDAAYPDRCLAIELDGAQKRMSPDALQADLERQNALVDNDWTFLRFTFSDLTANRRDTAARVHRMHDRLPILEQESAA